MKEKLKDLFVFSLRLGPRQLFWVVTITLAASFLEVIGVGIVYAFAGALFEQRSLSDLPLVGSLLIPYQSDLSLQYWFAGIAIIVLFAVKGLVGFGALAYRSRFAGRLCATFAADLMLLYSRQQYEAHLRRHSGELAKNILQETIVLSALVIAPVVTVAAELLVVSVVVIFLFLLDPQSTLFIVGFFAIGYGLVYFAIQPLMAKAGQTRIELAGPRSKAAMELFGGMREVILSGREEYFVDRFAKINWTFSSQENRLRALPGAPSFAVQFLAVLVAIALLLWQGTEQANLPEVMATLALFGAAALRLMPSFNAIVRDFSTIKGHWPTFSALREEQQRVQANSRPTSHKRGPIPFADEIKLTDISYSYPGSDAPALSQFSITIAKGECVGIIGPTGSGKSTLIEIMLGLLSPCDGEIIVDGQSLLPEMIDDWQAMIGYVPQSIFLLDESIARNIAFGLADNEIDQDAMRHAAKLAQIANFIEEDLPQGYDTIVGERGTRLSGGQIQRIGIARALYRQPKILIFDEATSALDSAHEELVNQALRNLAGQVTIIVVAHRTATIEACDRVVEIKKS